MRSGIALAALFAGLLGGGTARAADVTVAFLGDQSTHRGAMDVLTLVREQGADLLVLQGDLGYSDPSRWIENMDGILGPRFPVLAVVGNHEEVGWSTYRTWLEERVADLDELSCEGRIGVKAHCRFRGISVVQTAPGVYEVPGVDGRDDYAGYLRDTLADAPDAWRICSWHKLQRDMQVGGKSSNSTGWGVYEECRKGGGIVATAHEHSYSRTHLMSNFSEQEVVHRSDHLEIGSGQTFAFVSGLGGNSVRAQTRGGDWWASIYTATQGATHGALFCTFGEYRASCEFKAIDGSVPDRFTLETLVRPGSPDAGGPRVADREPELVPAPAPAPAPELVPDPPTASVPASGNEPAAPTALASSRYSSRSGELFWARPATFGLRYEVRLDDEVVTNTNGTSHYMRDLVAGKPYTFEVVAIDRSGGRSTPASVTLSGIKGTSTTSSDSPSPAPAIPSDEPVEANGGGTDEATGATNGGTNGGTNGSIARASTSVPGNLAVRLDVYDRRSYELFWERVPGIPRYRLTRADGELVQDASGTSRYFTGIDTSLETDYRIEAIDRNGTTVREMRVRVAPSRSAQLAALD